jgi:hypothetical protein
MAQTTIQIRDANNVLKDIVVDQRPDGSLVPLNQKYFDYRLDLSRGYYTDMSVVDKYGFNDTLRNPIPTGEFDTVWEFGPTKPVYTYPTWTNAPIDRLSSSDAADTMDIEVQGLDINGDFVEQTITLTGQTPVALTTALWRVFRMQNVDNNPTTGQGVDISGTVYCFANGTVTAGVPDNSADVYAVIIDGNNQTQMAVYTIPKGKTGYLMAGEIGILRTGTTANVEVAYRSRRFGEPFKVKKTIGLDNAASSNYQDDRAVWDPIPELTDIEISAAQTSSNGIGAWATLCILLIDN